MKKIIGYLIEILLAVVVLFFEFTQSVNFFLFVFPADQWYLAYTGFGLTSGALLGYLYMFMYHADTKLRKTVAAIMMVVGIAGILATAGFGMQIEAWTKAGWQMTQSDFDFMILAVKGLILAHAIALIAYLAGDAVKEAWNDDDRDGVPNFLDPDYKGKKKDNRVFALEQKLEALEKENKRLRDGDTSPTNGAS